MKRYTAWMLGLFLAMSADAVLGHGGHGGGNSGGHHGGRVAVRTGPVFANVRPAPAGVVHPRFFRRSTVVIGGVVVAAPFYPYPYPYYAPAYVEPPVYVEQGGTVYYYCPDYGDYYPNVASCPSPWMKVLP
jgi:hypothetical protein